jgi:hypothetical protein
MGVGAAGEGLSRMVISFTVRPAGSSICGGFQGVGGRPPTTVNLTVAGPAMSEGGKSEGQALRCDPLRKRCSNNRR